MITPMVSTIARGGASAAVGSRSDGSIDLYWLPLGAGGWFVRLSGRLYEAFRARVERRRPLDLYHSALEVRVPEGRFIIENSWPIVDGEGASRGVVLEGPVFSRQTSRWRVFRYEVRRWRNGAIPNAAEAVGGPQRLSEDLDQAHRLLDVVGSVPRRVWGRDETGTGDMWNSNSVISWLLTRTGLRADLISPPPGGRAPGWVAGLDAAASLSRGTRAEGPKLDRDFGPSLLRKSRPGGALCPWGDGALGPRLVVMKRHDEVTPPS